MWHLDCVKESVRPPRSPDSVFDSGELYFPGITIHAPPTSAQDQGAKVLCGCKEYHQAAACDRDHGKQRNPQRMLLPTLSYTLSGFGLFDFLVHLNSSSLKRNGFRRFLFQ
jgi:hypothetical protein